MTLVPAAAIVLSVGLVIVPICAVHAYDEVPAVSGGGIVSGQVLFHGTVPTRQIIPNKDLDVCGGPREDALLEVGPGMGVANTLVYLAEVPKGKAWPTDGKKPELDNVKCRFEPTIQVIHSGGLDVVNRDPVLHNTHGYYGRRTAFNTALPNQNQSITAELLKTGTVRVDCDAHGWMEGWVFVRDNPYYAITGEDGRFSIADVPPGTYTMVTLQPYSALVEQPIKVVSGMAIDLTVELKLQ